MIPQGGNTGLVAGAIDIGTARGAVVISLERLNRIRSVDADTFHPAGRRRLHPAAHQGCSEDQDCLFPLALGAQGSCQIGGNAASNAGGVNVLRYGMARDLICRSGGGAAGRELWNGFSGLRKDNRGYDLKQLFIGAEGTLGIITGVEVKLFPKPGKVETAYLGLRSFEAAISLFRQSRRGCSDLISAFEIIGAECMELARLVDPDTITPVAGPVHVLVELSSSAAVDLRTLLVDFLASAMENELIVDAVLAESGAQARAFWAIREGLVEGQAKRGYHVRTDLSVRISDIPPLSPGPVTSLRGIIRAGCRLPTVTPVTVTSISASCRRSAWPNPTRVPRAPPSPPGCTTSPMRSAARSAPSTASGVPANASIGPECLLSTAGWSARLRDALDPNRLMNPAASFPRRRPFHETTTGRHRHHRGAAAPGGGFPQP